MINTLRSVVNDDASWWRLLHDFYQHFKYRNIMTEDVVRYFNRRSGMNLAPIFASPSYTVSYTRPRVIPKLYVPELYQPSVNDCVACISGVPWEATF